MTDRKVPTPPKRSRFDGVGIVLAAVFEPPSGKGEKPGQTSKHRHRECVQSLDRMQLPHHHRKHRYAPLAATFFSGHDLATMKIGLQRAYSNCTPMVSNGHGAAPFGAHATLGNPQKANPQNRYLRYHLLTY